MKNRIKTIVSVALAATLVLGMVGCGQSQGQNQTQSQSKKDTKEFSPKLSTDTEYKLSVAGTYSNFESLESEFERFYAHYPNG